MAWSEAQLSDFRVAQFRAIEESRRIRAQRGPEPKTVYDDRSDEEVRIANRETTDAYFEAMGYSPKEIKRFRSQVVDCWRKLDTDRL